MQALITAPLAVTRRRWMAGGGQCHNTAASLNAHFKYVADLVAASAVGFARRFALAFDQAAIRREVLYSRKAFIV